MSTEVANLRDDTGVLTTIMVREGKTLVRLDETMRDIQRQMAAIVS